MSPSAQVALLGPILAASVSAPTPPPTPTTWDARPMPVETLVRQGCSDQVFVGVRGSGEPPPFGATIDGVRGALGRRVPVRTRVTYVDYPAVSPHTLTSRDLDSQLLDRRPVASDYHRSVATGTRRLEDLVRWSAESCPEQRLVLVGFSQGAEVITGALTSGVDTRPVAATILLGNPVHHPGQSVQEADGQVDTPATGLVSTLAFLRARALPSPGDDHRSGVRQLLREVFRLHEGEVTTAELSSTLHRHGDVLPAELYARTWSVCHQDDMVCDAAPAMSRILTSQSTLEGEFARSRPAHRGYTPQAVRGTLDAVVSLLQRSRPSSTVTGQPAPTRAAGSTGASRTSTVGTPGIPWAIAGMGLVAAVALGALGATAARRGSRR